MNIRRNLSIGIIGGWLNRVASIIAGLVLMPVLFRYLGKEELGLWFLLGQSGAFLALLDFGMSATVIRRLAFSNADGATERRSLSYGQVYKARDLIAVASVVYRVLGCLVFVVGLVCGWFLLSSMTIAPENREAVQLAWVILCAGHGLSVWAGLHGYVLQGMGYVGQALFLGMVINSAVVAMQIVTVLSGGGLVALAIISVCGALATRLAFYIYLRVKQVSPPLFQGRWRKEIFFDIYRPALKSWLTVLGGFLILKTDQFFIATFRGAAEIPAYHAAYQLASNLYMFAVSLSGSAAVFASFLWRSGHVQRLRSMIIQIMQCGLGLVVCGFVCLMLVGETVMALWLGSGSYAGSYLLLIFCITLTLQTQHEMLMTFSRATEAEMFVLPSLCAGGLNLVLSFVLVQKMGLSGIALGTLVAQLATNNWYGVLKSLERLNISVVTYMKEVVGPVVLLLLVTVVLCQGAMSSVASEAMTMVMVVLVSGGVLGIAVYFFVGRERLAATPGGVQRWGGK